MGLSDDNEKGDVLMRKKSKKWVWGLLIIVVVGVAAVLTFIFWPGKTPPLPSQEKIAVVNGVEITQKSFNHEMQPLLLEISKQETKPTESQMLNIRKKVLEKLIVNELLYQESLKDGIVINDVEVSDRIDQLKKQYPNEADFRKELTDLGISEEEFAAQMKKEMAVQEYVYKKFVENMAVTDKELSDYYQKYGKEKIRRELKQAKAQVELNAYVEKLKKDSTIESFLKIE